MLNIIKSLMRIPFHRYYREKNIPYLPEILTLTVTWRCNYKCKMCDVWKMDNQGKELEFENYRSLIHDKALSSIRVVRVTGGEPFAKKDVKPILKLLSSLPKIELIYINTNGSYKEKTIDAVKTILSINKKIKVVVNTSIDGMPGLHDSIRGINGGFDRTIQTLEALNALKAKTQRLELGINQTVLKPGKKHIDYVIWLANELKIPYHGEIAVRMDGGNLFSNFVDMSVSKKVSFEPYSQFNQQELITTLEMIQNGMGLEINFKTFRWLRDVTSLYFFSGLMQRLLYGESNLNPPCQALFSHLRIMPNGEVITCMYHNHELANVKDRGLYDIWKSRTFQNARKCVKECPGCWIGCEVIPNTVYSGNIVGFTIKELLGINRKELKMKGKRRL